MILYVIFTFVQRMLDLLAFIMLVGALASWFPELSKYKIIQMINIITFAVVAPVKNMFERLGLSGGPIDFSYLIAMVLVEVLALTAGHLATVFVNLF